MKPLSDKKGTQQLNGRIVALNRFISKCTNKCLSFFIFIRKNTSVFWNKNCDMAFQGIKKYLSIPIVLARSIREEILYLNLVVTSWTPIGVLLARRNKVQHTAYYISQILTNAQGRQPTIYKLDFTLKMVATELRNYFGSYIVIILTSNSLENVLTKPEVVGRLTHIVIELG